MNDYQVGNLNVDLINISQGSEQTLERTARNLSLLYNALSKFNKLNTLNIGNNLSNSLSGITKSLSFINVSDLSKFQQLGKATSSLQRFVNTVQKSNSKAIYGKLTSMMRSLSSAVNKFDNETLKKLERIANASVSLKALTTATTKLNKVGGGKTDWLGSITKLGLSVYSARRLGRFVADIAQKGADYTETLNLWETAMGKNVELAGKFVDKMNEAYGISEVTLMNAQAIFKNMLGSLGQISDETAYMLSEAVTQMAVDYASLYNVQFEKAFQKFQAALAGQVRPIRSVSGYDITENTLYQLYQSLGGTKSVRNLSRTEKQLLSILAIFNQMTASGAVGDLKKTMESFANQSRVMAESWKQVQTYSGIVLTYTIEQMGVLKYINAILMFVGDALKFYAEQTGAIQSFGGDPFASTEESALDATEAIEELNGTLLDFDKFRSLTGSEENIAIDEILLSALKDYDSILGNANSEARELADTWLNAIGVFRDVNGELSGTDDALTKIGNTLKDITVTMGILLGLSVFSTIVRFGSFLNTYAITPLINLGKSMWNFTVDTIKAFIASLNATKSPLLGVKTSLTGVEKAMLGVSIAFLSISLVNFINSEMSAGKRIVTMFLAIAGAIAGAGIALKVFSMDWAGALSVAGMVAGGILTVSSTIPQFANGASDIDSGTLFVAGEMGKTEAVYTGSNGKTNVANVQQMKTAYFGALSEWWQSAKRDIPQFREVSKTGIYEIAKNEGVRRGEW